jgi:GrpB-like predicted nucleotidyltransferase (UPF0157 family)
MIPALMVEIVPYDSAWPDRFARLGRELRRALGDVALRIDHIGSTAVPVLAAKPVIDVQISVASFQPLDTFRAPLEGLGYVYRADNTERTKRYFRERRAPSKRLGVIPRLEPQRRGISKDERTVLEFNDSSRAAGPPITIPSAAARQCLGARAKPWERTHTPAFSRCERAPGAGRDCRDGRSARAAVSRAPIPATPERGRLRVG